MHMSKLQAVCGFAELLCCTLLFQPVFNLLTIHLSFLILWQLHLLRALLCATSIAHMASDATASNVMCCL